MKSYNLLQVGSHPNTGGLSGPEPSGLFSAAHFLSAYCIQSCCARSSPREGLIFSFHMIPRTTAIQSSCSDAEVEPCPGDLVLGHNTVVTHAHLPCWSQPDRSLGSKLWPLSAEYSWTGYFLFQGHEPSSFRAYRDTHVVTLKVWVGCHEPLGEHSSGDPAAL